MVSVRRNKLKNPALVVVIIDTTLMQCHSRPSTHYQQPPEQSLETKLASYY